MKNVTQSPFLWLKTQGICDNWLSQMFSLNSKLRVVHSYKRGLHEEQRVLGLSQGAKAAGCPGEILKEMWEGKEVHWLFTAAK